MNFDFEEAYSAGRKRLSFLRLFRKKNLLLSLEELTAVVRPRGENYAGIKDIRVKDIIGSESRSSDFSMGFLPVHKWMAQRWTLVRKLLLDDKISEPIKVLKYGGSYFVRDGNHRVSVAKTNAIDYLTAEVTVLQTDVDLPVNMSRPKIPVFLAKYNLQMETSIFDVIPEENFSVLQEDSWRKIKESIFVGHKKWYITKNGYQPEDDILIQSWNIELYETTIEFIRRHHLSFLSPYMLETDVFCEIMDMWALMPDAWFPDVYNFYTKRLRRRNLRRVIFYFFARYFRRMTATRIEEESLFLQATRLLFFRPLAVIPAGNKTWYRFLRKQILESHYRYQRRLLGRNPYMHELTSSWYDELFEPAQELYKKYKVTEPFPAFYIRWMDSWQRHILNKGDVNLEESLKLFLKKRHTKV